MPRFSSPKRLKYAGTEQLRAGVGSAPGASPWLSEYARTMTARLLGRAAARCSGHTAPAHRPLHRGFSTSSALLAKRAPRPSPRVRDLDFRRKQEKSRTEQQQTQHAPAEPDGTHRPWPIPALAAAFVSGMMAVSATKAVRILDDFTAPSQSSKLTRAEAQRLCDGMPLRGVEWGTQAHVVRSRHHGSNFNHIGTGTLSQRRQIQAYYIQSLSSCIKAGIWSRGHGSVIDGNRWQIL